MTKVLASSLATALVSVSVATAQTITPAQFKAACEQPGNIVSVVGTLKVTPPALPPPLVVVNAPCQILLSPDSAFEADNLNMRFTGAVSIQGSAKAGVFFKATRWAAPSISVGVSGAEAQVLVDESRLTASAGDIMITLGDDAVIGVTGPINGVGNALNAAGALSMSGGRKLTASFETTRLRAGTNMTFSMAGPEATFGTNNTAFVAAAGAFGLSSPGSKASVSLTRGAITAPTGIALSLPGAESKATLTGTRATATAGSVTLLAGSPGQSFGALSVDLVTIAAGGAVSLVASAGANKGEAVLGNSRLSAGAAIVIQSDLEGLTNVLNNTLSSPTEIRAFTGVSGACIAEGNNATAPLVSICP